MTRLLPTRVAAVLALRSTVEGGLKRTWPAPTPSFSIQIDGVLLGAEIYTVDMRPLEPGESDLNVELLFWAPIARELARPRVPFLLVYVDRVIGSGTIKRLQEDLP